MSSNTSSDSDKQLRKLQALLLGDRELALESLKARLENPELRAKDVAAILPNAIQGIPDQNKLSRVMADATTNAVRVSIERDSEHVASVLYPAVLPAIRKSIEQTLQGFMENIDLLVRQRFSVESIKWRIEALRTGVPFREIILRKMLRYEAEQIFLIQRGSGLLAGHVASADSVQRDSDAVSAMLTAIESFVHESFSQDDGGHLNRMTVGDRIVYLEHGPFATIASVVRGVATPEYLDRLRVLTEDVHAAFGRQLENFNGTVQDKERLEAMLETALERRFKLPDKNGDTQLNKEATLKKKIKLIGGTAMVVLLLATAFFGYRAYLKSRVDKLVDELSETVGIVPTGVTKSEGTWTIHGLRDPASPDPATIVFRRGLGDKVALQLEPYWSLTPEMTFAHAREMLQAPAGVNFDVGGSTLKISGQAPIEWLASLRNAKLPMNIERLDASGITLNPTSVRNFVQQRLGTHHRIAAEASTDGTIELKAPAPESSKILELLERELPPNIRIKVKAK